jgi:hypothetical protein
LLRSVDLGCDRVNDGLASETGDRLVANFVRVGWGDRLVANFARVGGGRSVVYEFCPRGLGAIGWLRILSAWVASLNPPYVIFLRFHIFAISGPAWVEGDRLSTSVLVGWAAREFGDREQEIVFDFLADF